MSSKVKRRHVCVYTMLTMYRWRSVDLLICCACLITRVISTVVVVVARRQRQHAASTVRRRHVSYWSSADWLQSTAARSGYLLSHVWYVDCTVLYTVVTVSYLASRSIYVSVYVITLLTAGRLSTGTYSPWHWPWILSLSAFDYQLVVYHQRFSVKLGG